jgi:hypothetical protein
MTLPPQLLRIGEDLLYICACLCVCLCSDIRFLCLFNETYLQYNENYKLNTHFLQHEKENMMYAGNQFLEIADKSV